MHTIVLVQGWLTNIIYLRKHGQVLKVDLDTWKFHPIGGYLFIAKSTTMERTIQINTFQVESKIVEGIDQHVKWYASLLEP